MALFSAGIEARWQGCSLARLQQDVAESIKQVPRFAAFSLPLTLRLATQRVAGTCLHTELASELLRLARHIERSQAERVRRELELIAMLE